MPTTPIYALPYPAAADPADVPLDMRELAEQIEAVFPGKELAYAQITTAVTVSATTEATANVVITAPAVTFDGTASAMIEFFTPRANPQNVAAANLIVWLFQDGASIGSLGELHTPAAGYNVIPLYLMRRLTPPAGSRTYSVRASVSTGNGAIGNPGGGLNVPAFLRIVRV